ncbi:MAG: GH92 family glycosyl hydrolase [Prevotellaceae bacterium]|jgi:predicted alpha-1,2-mannosidase|nr:GH92 family glycosyl hydrolase [Prevotellaceae bacterium]
MKKYRFLTLLLMLSVVFATCRDLGDEDYTLFVDPYIGSGGHGHVFVGASAPFGAVQLGPNNIHKGWDWCSGYHYSDSILIGFSHTHLSGTGCTELGDVMLMPYLGDVRTSIGNQNNIDGAYSSYYRHENEAVAPGYYSLEMENGVKVELTASERVGFHKYLFPKDGERHVMINLKDGNGDRAVDTYIKLIDEYTVEGHRFSKAWSPYHEVYFTLKSDKPIARLLVFEDDEPVGENEAKGRASKGVLSFKEPLNKIHIKTGISSVSCANAAANIEAEIPHWDFDKTLSQTKKKWNDELSKVKLETKDGVAKRIFYTAMYHACIAPTMYCDVNGEFRGNDRKVYSDKGFVNYSTFSLWDTYRTAHELYTLIQPERVNDFVNSMLGIFDQQGKLPIWPLVGGETNQMPGYSAVPVIADAYLKGFTGFDAERAFNAMKTSATYPRQNGVNYVMEKSYIPCDKVYEATSIGMEYAVDDWGIAAMAKRMGKDDDFEYFARRANYYKMYFDTSISFIRPRMDDGSWRTPYNPIKSEHYTGDFCEGTGWQYTFFVPHDPEGLIELFGGDEKFEIKLDSLFTVTGDMGEKASADITGLIGQYAHGNEPSHHVAYLYGFAGRQWKTAEKVRFILDEFYTDKHDGIIGNEDCGQMSAWYIMSCFGFYPVNPSNGIYVFGSPRFEKMSINVGQGKTFEIETVNHSAENIYIQSVELNGKAYNKGYIRHSDIVNGGSLKYVMGNKANPDFGSSIDDRPKSFLF